MKNYLNRTSAYSAFAGLALFSIIFWITGSLVYSLVFLFLIGIVWMLLSAFNVIKIHALYALAFVIPPVILAIIIDVL